MDTDYCLLIDLLITPHGTSFKDDTNTFFMNTSWPFELRSLNNYFYKGQHIISSPIISAQDEIVVSIMNPV